jgi:hypothetical protein
MKEFFLILFLAKSIAITTEPIDIVNSVSLILAEPVSAITSGENLLIDVTSSLVGTIYFSNIVWFLEYLKTQYPNGSVKAILTTSTGQSVILDNVSGSANGENAELVISSSSGLQTGIEFSELKIESSKKLLGVSVTWQNHSK